MEEGQRRHVIRGEAEHKSVEKEARRLRDDASGSGFGHLLLGLIYDSCSSRGRWGLPSQASSKNDN